MINTTIQKAVRCFDEAGDGAEQEVLKADQELESLIEQEGHVSERRRGTNNTNCVIISDFLYKSWQDWCKTENKQKRGRSWPIKKRLVQSEVYLGEATNEFVPLILIMKTTSLVSLLP